MKKILLSLGEELLEKLDVYCKSYSFERSEFIRSLIRDKVLWKQPDEIGEVGNKIVLKPREKVTLDSIVNPRASSEADLKKQVHFKTDKIGELNLPIPVIEKRVQEKGFVLCEHGTSKSLCKKCMFK